MTETLSNLLPDVLFYLFSAAALGGALGVLLQRNPMSCAVSLVVSVLSIALLYFLLSGHFVGVAQVIVYAGAIVVLFIFVIMLLNLSEEELGRFKFSLFKTAGAFTALAVLLFLVKRIRREYMVDTAAETTQTYGSAKEIGRLLFGEFVLPFELTSILILSAMVAGVVLAKKDLTPKHPFSFVDWVMGLVNRPK